MPTLVMHLYVLSYVSVWLDIIGYAHVFVLVSVVNELDPTLV